MTICKEQLIEIIKSVSLNWILEKNDFVYYWDVNSGSCGEFAFQVMEQLPTNSGVQIVNTGTFLEEKGLESFGEKGEFSNHVWLVLNGEHFDIERPYGVTDFMELPYFQREIEVKKRKMNSDYNLYNYLKDKNLNKFSHLVCDLKYLSE